MPPRRTPARRKVPVSALNDLTGREWIRFTRSWFVAAPPRRSSPERGHPAKFPEALCTEFVRFFTKKGMVVLDPFAGTGSALVAAARLGRHGIGIEIHPPFARLAAERTCAGAGPGGPLPDVLCGDAREVLARWTEDARPSVDFVLTSPPYWDMLSKGRGGVRSVHRRRAEAGLATTYTADPKDLANLHDYDAFLDAVVATLAASAAVLRPSRYLVVVLQNLRDETGAVRRLAWDVAARLDDGPLAFQGERIWCQDDKPLGIWGYPSTFVPNYHHHYCLVFRRPPDGGGTLPEGTTGGAPRRRRGASRPRSRGGAG